METPSPSRKGPMEITKEFLEERIQNFSAEIERLQGLVNHTAGMRDACSALLEKMDEKEPEKTG